MKTIRLIFLFLLLSSVSASAQKTALKFGKYHWFEGIEVAKSQNKFFLMYISQKGCDECKALNQKTFSDTNLITFLNERFVLAQHYFSSNYGMALALDFRLSTVPALLIQNPNSENKPLIIYGVKDAETLKKELQEYISK